MTASKTLPNEQPRLGEGIYTSSDIANILKIHKNRARYLINEYLNNKFKVQQQFQYRIEVNGNFAINFHALIEIFVFEKLRGLKVSSKRITKFHDRVSEIYKSPYPFALTEFLVSGKDLYFKNQENWVTGDEYLQLGLKDIVEELGDKIQYDDETNLAAQYYPLGKSKSIVVDPEYRFGQPIIKDTSLMVENVYDLYLAEEKKIEYVAALYDITKQQMQDVIEYMAA